MAKKKKTKKEIHVLHEDCKVCMRERNLHNPLVSDVMNAERLTLVTLKGTLPYLMRMTDTIERWFCTTFSEEKDSRIITEYFADIKNLLELYARMKSAALDEPTPR